MITSRELATPDGFLTDVPVIIDEVFHRQVYTRGKEFSKAGAVLDIGANIGVFSLFAASQGVAEIHCYEPHPENYLCLTRNADVKGIVIHDEAVADYVGMAQLYESAHAGGHLLFPRSGEGALTLSYAVRAVDLETVWSRTKEPVQFVKMDCEGAEGLILRDVELSRFEAARWAIEYHDNVSPMTHREIAEKFARAGYAVTVKHREGPFGYVYAAK